MRSVTLRRRLFATTAVLAALLAVAPVPAAQESHELLVLYSTRRDAPLSIVADRELPRLLEAGLPGGVNYFAEYIDAARISTAPYQAAFSEFLSAKYKGRRFDLVVAIQDAAVEFLGKHGDAMFPGVPTVFLAMSPPSRPRANETGVIVNVELAATVELALVLQPDLRNVFVISGAGATGKGYDARAREQLRRFEPRLSITYLSGLKTTDLEARLSSLPRQSIVYYLVVYEDGEGTFHSPLKYLDRIGAVANAPIYSWSESTLDHGVVGGKLLGQQPMVEALADLSLRVLRGESPATIPVSSPDLSVAQVDWRQLRRWGLSTARVPAGTAIMFREPTIWERYKFYVLGAIALFVAQSALIAGLVLQRSRRRRAEAQVRGSEAQLRTSYGRIRDLAGRLLNAQEAERSRIARELHDDIGQQIALLEIDLALLQDTLPPAAHDGAGQVLTRAHGLAKSVHDLSHQLHPAKLRLIGLVAAIQGLRQEASRADVALTFTHENVPASLPLDLTLALFRIAQEGVQNALKYAKARNVTIHLSGGAERLSLTIADNGMGFDVNAAWGKGLGLISIGERLEAIGGSFNVHSAAGQGTRLEVSVPLPVRADSA